MRLTLAVVATTILLTSVLPLPAASATAGLNLATVTPRLQAALEGATADLGVIVEMSRPWQQSDVDFLDAHDAKIYGKLESLPIAFFDLDVDTIVALSNLDGVKWLDLDRELQFNMVTAVQATQAGAVWGETPKYGITSSSPLLDASGDVINGKGVTVAVVDSGVDGTHPDLGPALVANKKLVCPTPALSSTATGKCYGTSVLNALLGVAGQPPLGDAWVDVQDSDSTSGHGTHVAGIVAGRGVADSNVKGAAPGAGLVAFGVGEAIFVAGAMESWDYIYQHRNDNTIGNPKVVTNSFGDCPGTPSAHEGPDYDLISLMVDAGITFTFAAGNLGDLCDQPADGSVDATSTYCDWSHSLAGLICVANGNDGEAGKRSDMTLNTGSSPGLKSNKGTWPDVAAPGTSITSTVTIKGAVTAGSWDRHPYYGSIGGTSMATPHVAGIVALMLQANPTLSPAAIEDILEDNAIQFQGDYESDPENPDTPTSFNKGHGLVNALASVNEALSAAHAGSGLLGIGGDLHIYQPATGAPSPAPGGGADAFVFARDYTTVASNAPVSLSLRFAGAASYSGTTLAAATKQFLIKDSTGATVRTIDGVYSNSGTEERIQKAWTVDLELGDYVLESRVNGALIDSLKMKVVGAIPPEPVCGATSMTLGFGPEGVILSGGLSSPADKVRVDVVEGGVATLFGVQIRETAEKLTSFEIPLSASTLVPGSSVQILSLHEEVPCLVHFEVPDITPEGLAALQPAGIVQVGNPYVNPGFEATALGEANSEAYADPRLAAKTVAPPTVMFRADDSGTLPASTHEVSIGGGVAGNALKIRFDPADNDHNLVFGQLFSVPGQGPYGWIGADSVAFSYKTDVALTDFHVSVHWDEGGVDQKVTKAVYSPSSADWTRVELDFSDVPADANLTSVLVRIRGPSAATILVDNVVVGGSTFALGDLRSDLTDGYTPIIFPASKLPDTPMNAIHTVQSWATPIGDYFVAQVEVRDYTDIAPRAVPFDELAGGASFGIFGSQYVTDGLSRENLELGGLLAVKRDQPSRMLMGMEESAAMAQSDNAQGAVMWTWVNVEEDDGYEPPIGGPSEPTSGYYSIVRNSLQDYGLADSLDYAFTPILLDNASLAREGEAQTLRIVVPSGGDGFDVEIHQPATGWIEWIELTVTGQIGTSATATRTVKLEGDGSTKSVHFSGTPGSSMIASTDGSIFTTGDSFAMGKPIPDFDICDAAPGCATPLATIPTLSLVSFDGSPSVGVTGPIVDWSWDFGDASGATGEQVTHLYADDGTYTITLTVTDEDGESESFSKTLEVTNQAPVAGILAGAGTITRLESVAVSGFGDDVDGAVARVALLLDGVEIAANETGGDLAHTVPGAGLALGSHTLAIVATDDDGAASEAAESTFTVANVLPTGSLTATPAIVKIGDNVTFAVAAADVDSASFATNLTFGDGSFLASPPASVTHAYAAGGAFTATLTITDSDGATREVTAAVSVDAEAPETTASFAAPPASGWYTENVTVTISVTDDRPGAKAFASLDGAAPSQVAGPITVGGDGTHLLSYYGEDAVGNVEAAHEATFKIDSLAPATTDNFPEDGSLVWEEPTILVATGSDASSGMSLVEILIDGEVVANGTASATYEWHTSTFFGPATVGLRATDVAGNSFERSVDVIVSPFNLTGTLAILEGLAGGELPPFVPGPEVPEVPGAPEAPELPALPPEELPEAPGAPELPAIPPEGAPEVPALPEVPEAPGAPEAPELPVAPGECAGYPVTPATPTGTGPYPGACAPAGSLAYAWVCVGYGSSVDYFGTSAGFPRPAASTPHPLTLAQAIGMMAGEVANGGFDAEAIYVGASAHDQTAGSGCSPSLP